MNPIPQNSNTLRRTEIIRSLSVSPTSSAVGLCLLEASLRPQGSHPLTDNAQTSTTSASGSSGYGYLQQLSRQRALLQRTVSTYIDARARH
jgi:hypothetical protein